MEKRSLIDAVLDQILMDVENRDLTAIEELLTRVHEDVLRAFLPEQVE